MGNLLFVEISVSGIRVFISALAMEQGSELGMPHDRGVWGCFEVLFVLARIVGPLSIVFALGIRFCTSGCPPLRVTIANSTNLEKTTCNHSSMKALTFIDRVD